MSMTFYLVSFLCFKVLHFGPLVTIGLVLLNGMYRSSTFLFFFKIDLE